MLRVALFGAGRIGQVHARSVALHDEARLAWVVDPVLPAAEALADRYGATAGTVVDDALADPGVDAVVIASPTPTHIDLLRRAVMAGKPVLCEKPIDLDLHKIDRCWAEIAPYQPTVMMGFNRRFDPTFRQIRQRVEGGEIGTLRTLRITSRDPQPPPRSYLDASGGIFRDMTIHDFDMARYFLGEVAEVYAAGAGDDHVEMAATGDAHQAMVLLRSRQGALCSITNSRTCVFGHDQRIEAFGDSGMLEAANQTPVSVRAYTSAAAESAVAYQHFFVERYREAYLAEFSEFVRTVREGLRPAPGFADGRAALALAEAAIESAATGRAVAVPGANTISAAGDITNGALT